MKEPYKMPEKFIKLIWENFENILMKSLTMNHPFPKMKQSDDTLYAVIKTISQISNILH